jgi:6-phosphogluconolactonase
VSERNCGELRIYATPQELEEALADLFLTDAREAIQRRGSFFVALAGGRTPQAAYALLAGAGRRDAIDWQRVFIYFGDERCVPPESDESNYKMALDALLSKVPVPTQNVHRMHGEDEPARAARAYAQMLVETMGEAPRFDLILLGMGADGHTASLFPEMDPNDGDDELVRAVYVEKLGAYRLTLTPRVINNARHVAIALVGSEKAPALRDVREGPYDPIAHPVQIVSPHEGTLTWIVDKAAASMLSTCR